MKELINDLETSENSAESDSDFEPYRKKSKGQKNKQHKMKAKKVRTPGNFNVTDSSEVDNQSQGDEIFYHEVQSIETLDNIEVTESSNVYTVEGQDLQRVQSVAENLATGKATIGNIDGQRVLMNISPITSGQLLYGNNNFTTTRALPQLNSQIPKFHPPTKINPKDSSANAMKLGSSSHTNMLNKLTLKKSSNK